MYSLLLILISLYLIWRAGFKRRNSEPPELPGKLPLIGHILRFVGINGGSPNDVLTKISKECEEKGGVVKIYFGPMSTYAITDPEDGFTVASACLEKFKIYKFMKPLVGNGLIAADVDTWKINRKLLSPAFSQHVLDGFIEIFNTQAQSLVDQFANVLGKEFNHEQTLRINSLETICATAIGIDAAKFRAHQHLYLLCFEELIHIYTTRVKKFWLHSDFIYNFTSLKRRQDENMQIIDEFTNLIMRKRISEVENRTPAENESKKFKPFMDLMLELNKNYSSFTEEQIRGETNTIIAGGHDTISSSLAITLTLLGSDSRVQEKAYEEILQVLGNSNTVVDKEALSKLVYIEAILKESLRLYPSAPFISRQLDRNIKLKNCTLEANNSCFLFIFAMNGRKIWGPDADKFRPERWLEKETLPNLKYYAPFSFGRRSCIGKTYGLMSMKVTVAKVLQNYRIKSDASKMVIEMAAVMRPVSGHYITLEKRSI